MDKFVNHRDKTELKEIMDKAISAYIGACTGADPADVDYSYINQEIDDAIDMLGGTPAKEE